MSTTAYASSVFINCPFDDQYRDIFSAMVFAVFDCGYLPRCAQEAEDGGQVRIDKIVKIISECKFGIHEISRVELDLIHNLPRFNMPLGLGLFLGAKKYGSKNDKSKICLILDREAFRYQIFISDIAGQDIRSHNNDPDNVIGIVRNWLQNSSRRVTIPGGAAILERYRLFRNDLPHLCVALRLREEDLIFNDYAMLVSEWLKQNPV